jgi:hypothetical protein
MPVGAIIGTIELTVPYLAMRYRGWRIWLIIITILVTLLASLLLWQLPEREVGGRLFAIYILATFGAGYAVLMGISIANTAGYTKRSVTSSGLFVGYCLGKKTWCAFPGEACADIYPGNFMGPLVFIEKEVRAEEFVSALCRSMC